MPLPGEGMEFGAHRRQRPGGFPLRRRRVHSPLKALRHPLRILLQLAGLHLTVNLSGRQIHAPTERQDRQSGDQRDDNASACRSPERRGFDNGWCIHTTPETGGHAWAPDEWTTEVAKLYRMSRVGKTDRPRLAGRILFISGQDGRQRHPSPLPPVDKISVFSGCDACRWSPRRQ